MILSLLVLAPLIGTTDPQLVHPWGAWQKGAWVQTASSNSSVEGTTLLERQELTEQAEDGYTLKSALLMEGGDVETEMTNSWAMGGYAHVLPFARVIKTETVTVAGREYECDVWEGRWMDGDSHYVDRSWVADDVELPLRWESKGVDGEFAMRATRMDESLLIGKSRIACTLYEGGGEQSEATFESKLWVSLDVPGGVARMETSAGDATTTREVVSFRGDRRRR